MSLRVQKGEMETFSAGKVMNRKLQPPWRGSMPPRAPPVLVRPPHLHRILSTDPSGFPVNSLSEVNHLLIFLLG